MSWQELVVAFAAGWVATDLARAVRYLRRIAEALEKKPL
jgi:hypothetical protein